MTTAASILDVIKAREPAALFVTEIKFALEGASSEQDFELVLQRLADRGDILIATKGAPDPHLADADLRIVALPAPNASSAIEAAWQTWLRGFLAEHRCS